MLACLNATEPATACAATLGGTTGEDDRETTPGVHITFGGTEVLVGLGVASEPLGVASEVIGG